PPPHALLPVKKVSKATRDPLQAASQTRASVQKYRQLPASREQAHCCYRGHAGDQKRFPPQSRPDSPPNRSSENCYHAPESAPDGVCAPEIAQEDEKISGATPPTAPPDASADIPHGSQSTHYHPGYT